MEDPNVNLFIEVLMIMGLNNYNILPFQYLIEESMKFKALVNNNIDISGFKQTSFNELIDYIIEYKRSNSYEYLQYNNVKYHKSNMSLCFTNPINNCTCFVYFCEQLSSDIFNSIISTTNELIRRRNNSYSIPTDLDAGVLINGNNNFCLKIITQTKQTVYSNYIKKEFNANVEVFIENQILCRPYDNVFSPHYNFLDKDNSYSMMSNLNVKPSNLPKIEKEGIISKIFFNSDSNSLVEITRHKNSSEEISTLSNFYRLTK